MIVLYVLLALALAIVLLLCLPIRLLLQLDESGNLRVRAKLSVLSLFTHPSPAPRFSIRRYSPRALARRQRRETRRLKKKQAKLAKRKKAAAPASNATKPKPTLKQRVSKLKDTLSLVTSLIDVLHERLFRATHIHVHKLSITVGADDAAATALLYGALSASLNLLIEVLHQTIHLHMHHPENMHLQPDFLNKGIRAELDIRIHMRVYHALALGLRALIHYFKHKTARPTPLPPVRNSAQ